MDFAKSIVRFSNMYCTSKGSFSEKYLLVIPFIKYFTSSKTHVKLDLYSKSELLDICSSILNKIPVGKHFILDSSNPRKETSVSYITQKSCASLSNENFILSGTLFLVYFLCIVVSSISTLDAIDRKLYNLFH